MKLIFPFAVITLMSFAVGCSKSSSPKTDDSTPLAASAHTTNAVVAAADNADLFTCNASKGEGMCMQFDDLKLAEIGDARKSCSDPGEIFSTNPCPRAGLLGTCKEAAKGDDPAMTTFLYKSDATPTIAAARDFCAGMPGIFSAAVRSAATPG
jgi:hypothetical protein